MKVRAVVLRGAGGPEVLAIAEHEIEAPGAEQIRVRVAAVGLNRADLLQRRGVYPPPPGASEIPGLEYAGHVEVCGPGVREHRVGDAVMGIVAGGAMAEALVVHAREAMPVPSGMALTDAAAIPEVFLTAWDALFRRASLAAGQTLLVHAAASGVGTAAIQLARQAGARVVGTGRDAAKLGRLTALGLTLDHAIVVPREQPTFAKAMHAAVGPADVILDGVGAGYLAENLEALASKGTLVVIGLLAGATGELSLGQLLRKRATIVGSVLRSRPLEEKIELAQTFASRSAAGFASRALFPVVADVMPMAEVGEAHRRLESDDVVGKLVLAW